MNIEKYIPEGYSTAFIDRLEDYNAEGWLKKVCEFSNNKGGVIFFGVNEKQEVTGLKEAGQVAEKIRDLILKEITPRVIFLVQSESDSGKAFLAATIFPGVFPPYLIRTAEMIKTPSGYYSPDEGAINPSLLSPDARETDYDFNDYCFSKLRERYHRVTKKGFEDKQYDLFGLRNAQGKLTMAGALLADDSPIYHSRLFCTRWNGLNKGAGLMEALDDAEYSGSLLIQLEQGLRFIQANTRKMWKKTTTARKEFPDYCKACYKEALVNALVHQDFTISGSEIHIDIYDDRMTITSPGGMADRIEIQKKNLEEVESICRNPVLARIFKELGYMKLEASGLKEIVDEVHNSIHFRPEYEPKFYSESRGWGNFQVTLYNLNYNSDRTTLADLPETSPILHPERKPFEKIPSALENKILNNEMMEKISALPAAKSMRKNIQEVYQIAGTEKIIGRKEIKAITGYCETASYEMVKILKKAGLIEAVSGYGKGKYKFVQ